MRTGQMAIGLAAVVAVVPASFAQAPRAPGPGKPAEARIEAEERQTSDAMSDGPGSGAREPKVVSVAVPIGKVSVGPEFVGGEPIHVRRTTIRAGMTIVEVSTTPFLPVPSANGPPAVGRPEEQPASW